MKIFFREDVNIHKPVNDYVLPGENLHVLESFAEQILLKEESLKRTQLSVRHHSTALFGIDKGTIKRQHLGPLPPLTQSRHSGSDKDNSSSVIWPAVCSYQSDNLLGVFPTYHDLGVEIDHETASPVSHIASPMINRYIMDMVSRVQ
ncbi:hypothetical protein F2Q70_00013865 [Brassica cretica]|uniref:Uncharacterized protein n=1 Tax=Brassica cretica TaxID=69181 RepID=A0A8S9MD63_BRACR|nr:hypothetical protein F2Q70_00013865 [Brassica cretica]